MPPTKLHQATVVLHQEAGRGYFRIVLKAPGLAKQARPGQFVMLRVSENQDPILARPFGIAAVKSKQYIELFYRVVGRGTALLATVERDAVLQVQGPLGNGFPAPEKGTTPLLVAGGSGFPPLLYFALSMRHPLYMFLGARDKECLPPLRAIKSCREQAEKVYIATDDGSAGTRGFVTDGLAAFLDSRNDRESFVIYACGPRSMMAAVSKLAAERGISCFVSMEERMACGLGVCMGCSVAVRTGGYKRVCKEGPVFKSSDIDWSEQVVLPALHRK
ncbi:MAG: dihydroorotate dehydrogenase electron transfer subunit [Nitrospirota bacterium]|nr:dihydroorotate dehydrogenase electron transfer subunit [Nitrospirota bacterium]